MRAFLFVRPTCKTDVGESIMDLRKPSYSIPISCDLNKIDIWYTREVARGLRHGPRRSIAPSILTAKPFARLPTPFMIHDSGKPSVREIQMDAEFQLDGVAAGVASRSDQEGFAHGALQVLDCEATV